jgi:hypothetical protein
MALVTTGVMPGPGQSPKRGDPCEKPATLTLFPRMAFSPVSSPSQKPRNPVVKMTIREDGSISQVELLKTSNVKAWDEEIRSKMKTARYSEARGCGERTAEMRITIDYTS